jgi:hypothetical protein
MSLKLGFKGWFYGACTSSVLIVWLAGATYHSRFFFCDVIAHAYCALFLKDVQQVGGSKLFPCAT